MKRPYAASRALRQAILRVAAEHEYRPVKALYQPTGHYAQHAAMPVVRRENQRALPVQHSNALALLDDLPRNVGFRQLTLAIERMQLLRQLPRAVDVIRQE